MSRLEKPIDWFSFFLLPPHIVEGTSPHAVSCNKFATNFNKLTQPIAINVRRNELQQILAKTFLCFQVRLENEKEGFPITAVREIKILRQVGKISRQTVGKMLANYWQAIWQTISKQAIGKTVGKLLENYWQTVCQHCAISIGFHWQAIWKLLHTTICNSFRVDLLLKLLVLLLLFLVFKIGLH